jgi:DNA-binding transcriptional LysR family regulator
MELMQLEMFVAVIEEQGMSRAAARVGRTQPAVSIQIAKLEEEVGCPLLDRTRVRGYRPTVTGEMVYEYASRILGLRHELRSLLKDNSLGLEGNLVIGVYQNVSPRSIAKLTGAFGRKYPSARVHLLCERNGNYISDLTDRKIDLAFVSEPPEEIHASSNIVSTRLTVLPKKSVLWMVQHRMGRSHVVRVFEELVAATLEDARERTPIANHGRNSRLCGSPVVSATM